MKQFLIKIAGYGLTSLLILNGIAFLSLFLLRKANFYKPQFVSNGVVEKEFDYVVLGSSTGLTTLDTKLIDSITGKKGLNISMDDSGLSSHYLMLKHFYGSQKKTHCLVLTITQWDMAVVNPVLNENDYRFLPNIHKKYVLDYYKNFEHNDFKILSFSKYFPIIGVAYYNAELFFPSIIAAVQPKKRNRFDDKGNYSYPVSGGPSETEYKTTSLELVNPYYFKIKKFCLDNDIKLLLYQSPMFKTKLLANNDVELIDHSDLLKDPTLFYDNIHVNSNGRRICSEQFAKYFLAKK